MIKADYHVHSCFSSDSTASMKEMIEKAISMGMKKICFTDHMDYDFPDCYGLPFLFDPEEYFAELEKLTEIYKSKIKIMKGIELGLQPYLAPRYQELIQKYDFDFAIGSTHLVNGIDPYYPEYWSNISSEKGLELYFQSIIDNVKAFSGYQVYGHLDYVVRYAPEKSLVYTYENFRDIIDEMLKTIINSGLGIEVNTAGYKYGLGHAHPQADVLKRYKELGGEIITIGSDGHRPEHFAYDFPKAEQLLISLGFQYYAAYEKKKPVFERLG